MTVRISEKAKKSEIEEAIKKIANKSSKKGFNAKKYVGKAIRGLDGLDYQKLVRNEWN
jgi:predicted DNA binding CopG/RHH family protein